MQQWWLAFLRSAFLTLTEVKVDLFQMHALSSSSRGSTISGSVSPCFSSKPSSLASLPMRISGGSKTSMQQSNVLPDYGSATFGPLIPDPNPLTDPKQSFNPPVGALHPKIQLATDFPEFESVSESFKLLEEDTESNQSQLSSVLSSPHIAEQQQAVLNSIQRTQVKNLRFWAKCCRND